MNLSRRFLLFPEPLSQGVKRRRISQPTGGANVVNKYLAEGITESLINNLAQLPNLKVISSSSAFNFRDKPADEGHPAAMETARNAVKYAPDLVLSDLPEDPAFEGLRTDARYKDLMRRSGLVRFAGREAEKMQAR